MTLKATTLETNRQVWYSLSMILVTSNEQDYELIDSGNGKKLERYGSVLMSRPDPQAMWQPLQDRNVWNTANAVFMREGKTTKWHNDKTVPASWSLPFGGLVFEIRPTSFKHTGLFPEHRENWKWMQQILTRSADAAHPLHYRGEGPAPKVLNLFGYTGGASLACAQTGAEVVHVDGSKMAITWAKKNQELSGLNDASIRWILDDAILFLKREIKRGNTYDGIVMDPPAFGRGPKGEVWKIEEQFEELMSLCKQVLADKPLFFLINGYASGYSPIAYQNNLLELVTKYGGSIETGELAIEETGTKRLLPCGIFARWGGIA